MALEDRLLQQLEDALDGLPQPLFVALSGGVDSMLLLEAISRLQHEVTVIHVHHGLQASADHWADFCATQARRRQLPFICERVTVAATGGIEAAARAARYSAFARHVKGGSLLLAQHRDDQAETLLERLTRGAGVDGLAAIMPRRRHGSMTLVRPLLAVARAAIETLARSWQLDWIEDPSNQDRRFTRNWLRHELLPCWETRVPAIKQRLATSAAHLQQATRLQDDLASIDLQQLLAAERGDRCGLPVTGLPLPGLQKLATYRRHNLLRYWLAKREPYRPGAEVLQRIDAEVLGAGRDRLPRLLLSNGVLSRYRQRLYWLPKAAFAPPPKVASWRLADGPLQLAALQLVAQQLPEAALAHRPVPGLQHGCVEECDMTEKGATSGDLLLTADCERLELRMAVGGERLLLNGQHQRVSECWRAAGIAPWLRAWLPLFYIDGELVAAAAVGVADDWQAATDTGWRLNWFLPAEFAGY